MPRLFISRPQLDPKLLARIDVSYQAVVILSFVQVLVVGLVVGRFLGWW
jgi:hypothetical protein